MAAVLFAPLPIHMAGCRVFIFFSQLFLFSERQRIRRYAIRARVDVVCKPFADARLLSWWVKSAHLFRLTSRRLVHTWNTGRTASHADRLRQNEQGPDCRQRCHVHNFVIIRII
jgi:hypothetical protein